MIVYKLFIKILLFSLFITSNVFAQVDSSIYNSRLRHIKKAANKSFKEGDYFSTVIYLEKYLSRKPDKLSQVKIIADAHRASRNYPAAEKYYQQLVESGAYDECYYYLGNVQLYLGKYAEAKDNLNKFKKLYKGKDAGEYKKALKHLIETADKAPDILQDTLNFIITHLDLSINKAHVELSPLPLNTDEFIYSSLRSDTLIYFNVDDTIQQASVRKFYQAKRKGDNWEFNGELSGPFNEPNTENANACFNLDSSAMYFTRCKRNLSGKLICWLYKTEKNDEGNWGKSFALPEPINLKDANSTQPTVGLNRKEEEVLYFVSDREGGKGGKDIWFAEYVTKKGEFKEPKNAGKINTVFDEVSPFYDWKNKTLYFSSEGHPGIGGLDIFETIGELKAWQTPKNIGYPINSTVDDFYYIQIEDEQEGFFVSNRAGGVSLKNETCCDDIYHFKVENKIFIAIKGKVTELLGENKDSIAFVPGVEINLYAESDTSAPLLIYTFKTNDDGEFTIPLKKDRDYILKLKDSTHYATSRIFSTYGIITSDTLKHNFSLTAISDAPIVIPNIYYAFDKYDLLSESQATLDTTIYILLLENPDIIVEIGSHTDGVGTDAYNDKLSQNRAKSVVDYLVSKGIEKDRLQYKGYGKRVPIAPNKNTDGTDNPEGRQKNRRTEFRVIGKVAGASEIIYTE